MTTKVVSSRKVWYNILNIYKNNYKIMEKIKELLKELNLDEKEINVYLASIKIWTSPSSSIANSIWIAKSTVRYTLEHLVNKGLMTKIQKGNTTIFTA